MSGRMFHKFDNLIGFPLFHVVQAASKFQLNTFVVKEYSGKTFKSYKPTIVKPALLLAVEDGKVINIWLEQ